MSRVSHCLLINVEKRPKVVEGAGGDPIKGGTRSQDLDERVLVRLAAKQSLDYR